MVYNKLFKGALPVRRKTSGVYFSFLWFYFLWLLVNFRKSAFYWGVRLTLYARLEYALFLLLCFSKGAQKIVKRRGFHIEVMMPTVRIQLLAFTLLDYL